MSNQEVVDFIREQVCQDCDLGTICEKLMESCLASVSDVGGVGCDNMTVVIVAFLRGKTREEWLTEMKRRHSKGNLEETEEDNGDDLTTKDYDKPYPTETVHHSAEDIENENNNNNNIDNNNHNDDNNEDEEMPGVPTSNYPPEDENLSNSSSTENLDEVMKESKSEGKSGEEVEIASTGT